MKEAGRVITAPGLVAERVPIAGVDRHWLHCLSDGPQGAPTLLMLHGAAGSWHNFRRQMEWLKGHYRIVAPDLRGHGLSPWPGPSSIPDFVEDLVQLVERKIEGPFAIISHSFGGCLAAYLAQRWPARVRGVAFLNTAGALPQGPTYRFLKLFGRFAHFVSLIDPYWVACHGRVAHGLLWNTIPSWDTWHILPALPMPTMVLAGRHDLLVPWSSSQRMAELLPDCHYHLIPQGRHVCMWEHTQELHQQLEAWLSRLRWNP